MFSESNGTSDVTSRVYRIRVLPSPVSQAGEARVKERTVMEESTHKKRGAKILSTSLHSAHPLYAATAAAGPARVSGDGASQRRVDAKNVGQAGRPVLAVHHALGRRSGEQARRINRRCPAYLSCLGADRAGKPVLPIVLRAVVGAGVVAVPGRSRRHPIAVLLAIEHAVLGGAG